MLFRSCLPTALDDSDRACPRAPLATPARTRRHLSCHGLAIALRQHGLYDGYVTEQAMEVVGEGNSAVSMTVADTSKPLLINYHAPVNSLGPGRHLITRLDASLRQRFYCTVLRTATVGGRALMLTFLHIVWRHAPAQSFMGLC